MLAARAVVLAASRRQPIVPAALRGHHAGVQAGTVAPSLLRTWHSVDRDLGAAPAAGRRVLVVGGGMAGASLAAQAAAAGAAVTLVSRRWGSWLCGEQTMPLLQLWQSAGS